MCSRCYRSNCTIALKTWISLTLFVASLLTRSCHNSTSLVYRKPIVLEWNLLDPFLWYLRCCKRGGIVIRDSERAQGISTSHSVYHNRWSLPIWISHSSCVSQLKDREAIGTSCCAIREDDVVCVLTSLRPVVAHSDDGIDLIHWDVSEFPFSDNLLDEGEGLLYVRLHYVCNEISVSVLFDMLGLPRLGKEGLRFWHSGKRVERKLWNAQSDLTFMRLELSVSRADKEVKCTCGSYLQFQRIYRMQ